MTKKKARGFFVTGTGTDIGKTYVSGLLIQGFAKNRPVSYMKPIQTGCIKGTKGILVAPDFDYVNKTRVLITGNYDLHVPYRFEPACSPHLAAKRAKIDIKVKHIDNCKDEILQLPGMKNGCVVVEGAGGVLTPIGGTLTMLQLIVTLELPVIIVTTPALGTLNHTVLTLCALQSTHIPLAGIVMCNADNCDEDFVYKDNVEMIKAYIGRVPFLEIKHGGVCNAKTIAFCKELSDHDF